MKKLFHITTLLLLLISCKQNIDKKSDTNRNSNVDNITKYYSKAVNDTFIVSISLPNEYNFNKKNKFPVVYLLDANLYFDIVATTLKKYSEIGLIPPTILIGIGYKDIHIMDSLRSRDLTFPIAIPEYEMSVSGQADKFLSFLNNELIPDIDTKYYVDKNNRILMGHSMGGYFTIYAMHQNILNKTNLFSSYIAASPSTNYNHNYIIKEFQRLKSENKNEIKSYVTFGGLEDAEEEDITLLKSNEILNSFNKTLKEDNHIIFKGEIYSNLGHMDTPLPTFIKGLQFTLNKLE